MTFAAAASRVAVLVSISAREMNPRETSCLARSSSDWASVASACDTLICAASEAAVCVWTERSTCASTWPFSTHWPGSTSTRVTIPPSPDTPIGISRRAASEPVAVIVRATEERPGTTTETSGSCSVGFDAGEE